jgi:hypothetical protein
MNFPKKKIIANPAQARQVLAGIDHKGTTRPVLSQRASTMSTTQNISPGRGLKASLGIKGIKEVPTSFDVSKISAVADMGQGGFGHFDPVIASGNGIAIANLASVSYRQPLVGPSNLGLAFPANIPNVRPESLNQFDRNIGAPTPLGQDIRYFETRVRNFSVRFTVEVNSSEIYSTSNVLAQLRAWLELYPSPLNLATPNIVRPTRLGYYSTMIKCPTEAIVDSGSLQPFDSPAPYVWGSFGGYAYSRNIVAVALSATPNIDTPTQYDFTLTPRGFFVPMWNPGPGEIVVPASWSLDLVVEVQGFDMSYINPGASFDYDLDAVQVGQNARLPF